jgi:hypothetical protein
MRETYHKGLGRIGVVHPTWPSISVHPTRRTSKDDFHMQRLGRASAEEIEQLIDGLNELLGR